MLTKRGFLYLMTTIWLFARIYLHYIDPSLLELDVMTRIAAALKFGIVLPVVSLACLVEAALERRVKTKPMIVTITHHSIKIGHATNKAQCLHHDVKTALHQKADYRALIDSVAEMVVNQQDKKRLLAPLAIVILKDHFTQLEQDMLFELLKSAGATQVELSQSERPSDIQKAVESTKIARLLS